MIIKHGFTAAAVVTIGLSGFAFAQDKPGPQVPAQTDVVRPDSATRISESDRDFAKQAYGGNLGEVQLGQLAVQQARDDRVKDFGERLVRDHQAANDKLEPIADKYSIDLPNEPPAQMQQTYDRLDALSGAQFDRQFMAAMVKDHQEDLDKYAKALSNMKSIELRAYADQTVPVLREHLRMARQISQALRPVAGTSQPSGQPRAAHQRVPEPPNSTAMLNNLSAEGYRVTSNFRKSGEAWVATALKDGREVTVVYDPQTQRFSER